MVFLNFVVATVEQLVCVGEDDERRDSLVDETMDVLHAVGMICLTFQLMGMPGEINV